MFGFSKVALAVATLGAGLLMAACATTGPQSGLVTSEQGVTCSKCQVTWVKVPETNSKGRIVAYKSVKRDVCPDCMDAVTAFFNTGKLEHTCKTCGDNTMSICQKHDMSNMK